jgi:hypothetical protein
MYGGDVHRLVQYREGSCDRFKIRFHLLLGAVLPQRCAEV